ncbi:MAG: oligosaccharide flippase family protein [Candidatus Sungiibacteriota bacterium]
MEQLSSHSFAERFIRGNILGRFWSSAHTLIGLVTSFITLTALSVHQFGLYQLVLAAVVLADTLSVNFFDEVVQNDISRALSDNRQGTAKRLFHELAFLKVGLGILSALALFLAANLVSGMYDKDIGFYIRIVSFLVGIRAIRSTAQIFLASVVSLRALGTPAVEEISKLVLVSGFFFFSELSISRVLIATIVGATAALIYVSISFFREYRAFFRGNAAVRGFLLKDIVKSYGSWVLLRSAIKKIAKPIQPWLIVTLLNAEAVALYSLAANLVTMVKDLFPAASSSLLAWEVNNASRLKYIFGRGMKYSFFYGLTLMALAFFFVPLIVEMLFPKYLPAMPLFYIFLISVPFHGIQTLEMAILTALREQKVLAMRLFAEILMGFGIFIAFVPFMGLLAAGIGAVVPTLWRAWFLYGRIVKKYPELRPDTQTFFRFDEEDRLIIRRALTEAKSFLKKYSTSP